MLCLLLFPCLAVAQSLRPSTVQLDSHPQVLKKLNTLNQYLADEQWSAVNNILQQTQKDHAYQLVQVGPRHYLPVQTYSHLIVSRFSKAGLAAYREQYDNLAAGWYADAIQNNDPLKMKRIVQEYYNSSIADQALLWLGDHAWQQNQIDLARSYWTQLIPLRPGNQGTDNTQQILVLRYPDSDIPQPIVLARLILSRLALNNFSRAQTELDLFRQRYPQSEGKIAGQRGTLADILSNALNDRQQWQRPYQNETSTFAGNAERARTYHQFTIPYVPLWIQPLPEVNWQTIQNQTSGLQNPLLPYYPVTTNDKLFFSDARHVYALNQSTGKPLWPLENDPLGTIFTAQQSELASKAVQEVLGAPRFTLSVHDDFLFARLGSPVVSRPYRQSELLEPQSRIVCLDIGAGQGKLVWQQNASSFETDWEFEGTPLYADGKVFLAMRQSQPQLQWNVVCLNAGTGELLWNQKVCASLAAVSETYPEVSHHLLTWAADKLIYVTHHGAIVALNANHGRIEWASTYPNKALLQAPLQSTALKPALFAENIVIASPDDTNQIMGLDAQSGLVLWKRALPGGSKHLIGTRNQLVYLSGKHLWALDITNGKVVWQVPDTKHGTADYGQGVLTNRYVIWPHREEIDLVALQSGQRLQRIRLKDKFNLSGGHLVVSQQRLFVVQEDRIVAYGHASETAEQAERD